MLRGDVVLDKVLGTSVPSSPSSSFFPPLSPFFFFFFFFLADSFLVVFVLIFSRFLLGANLARAAVGMVGAGRCSCFRRFAG